MYRGANSIVFLWTGDQKQQPHGLEIITTED